MKSTVEDLGPVTKRLAVVISQEEVTQDLDAAYETFRKKSRIKGFRPGKAPRAILERMYKNEVENEVVQNLITDAYSKALEEQDLHPLGLPSIEKGNLNRESDFTFSATFEVAPDIEPHDYTGMELEREKLDVTEDTVLKQLEAIRAAHAHLESVTEERPLRERDAAIVNYQGYKNGKPLERVKNENFPIILGLNRFHKDLEQALIGVKKGERKEVEVTFPPDFANPSLAGDTVIFKLDVVDIKRRIIPELDDEFAKDLGAEFKTLQDLKDKIREQITENEKGRIDIAIRASIRKNLVNSHEFVVPESLVNFQVQQMMDNMERNLRQQGLNFETAEIVPEKLALEYRGPAEEQVRSTLILESVARKESITVDEAEVEAEIEKIAKQLGQGTDVVAKFYRDNGMIEGLKQRLLEQKTLQFIMEHATITEVEAAQETQENGDLDREDTV